MPDYTIGSKVGSLNQWYDEDIKIKKDGGNFKTLEEAQQKAKEIAKSDNEDAVIIKEGNEYHVFGTDEIGKLDPSGNDKAGQYDLHETAPNVLAFEVTQRDAEGVKTGGEKSYKLRSDMESVAQGAVQYVADEINLSESNKANWGFIGATFGGVIRTRWDTGSGLPGKPAEVMNIANEAIRTGFGNCREQACIAAQYLMMRDVPDVEVFSKHNHAFVVIGREPGSNDIDPSTWGAKAMVVDPWMNKSYPATPENFQKNMGICYEKWQAGKDPELCSEVRITDSTGRVPVK